jgi:hypothetical protein
MSKQKKILYVNYGGLGDHLAFSTLPEMCDKNGYDLYLSDRCVFRDNQIFELVWKLNPFFKGITDEEPNCGHDGYTNLSSGYDLNLSVHRNFEIKIGFGETILKHESLYPVIYYTPKKINEYEDYILVDLNAVSNLDYNLDSIKNYILNHKDDKFIFLSPTYSKSIIDISFFNELNITEITTENIFQYTDLIFSCKKFICLWSGGSVLAAAIKNQYKSNLEIDCFKNYNTHTSFGSTDKTHFWYDNINYIKS